MRGKYLWLLILASVLLVALACAKAAPTATPTKAPVAAPSPTARPAPTVTPTPARTGKYGGTLSYAFSSPEVPHLDPLLFTPSMVHTVVGNSYSELLRLDRMTLGKNDITITPELAERWDISSDGLTITFRLNRGVKFHNLPPVNGRELTSADVKYSLERAAFNPVSLFQTTYSAVERFEAPDPYTFVIRLKRFDPDLLYLLGAHHAWIFPKEVVDQYGDLKTALVGSGPFVFERWDKDSGVFFKKNPDYFEKGLPYVNFYEHLIIRDASARITAFRTGKLCCIESVTATEREELKRTNPDVQVEKILRNLGNPAIFMRYGYPLFNDIRVRRAISLGVDFDATVRVFADGEGQPRGPVSCQNGPQWCLSQEELRSKRFYQRYDPEEAKRLLKEAGVPAGTKLEFVTAGDRPRRMMAHMDLFTEQMKAIGLDLDRKSLDYAAMRRKQDAGDYTAMLWGADGQATALAHLTQNYMTGGSKNGMQLSDPKLDEWIKRISSTVDEAKRAQEMLEIQRYILENVLWKVDLIDEYYNAMWHPWVKGWLMDAPLVNTNNGFAQAWIDR
ncbi:MAG: hypothetical protein HYU29_07880 [Chloroflexi bacterium]|nr:hypothetical protein [Chloroflexota bacterium]